MRWGPGCTGCQTLYKGGIGVVEEEEARRELVFDGLNG